MSLQEARPCSHQASGATKHSSGHRQTPSASNSASVSASGGDQPLFTSNHAWALRTACSGVAVTPASWLNPDRNRHACALARLGLVLDDTPWRVPASLLADSCRRVVLPGEGEGFSSGVILVNPAPDNLAGDCAPLFRNQNPAADQELAPKT